MGNVGDGRNGEHEAHTEETEKNEDHTEESGITEIVFFENKTSVSPVSSV